MPGFWDRPRLSQGPFPSRFGAAFTLRKRKSGNIVVCFLGDAAIEEGVVHESLNFAKLKNLPILFFCENNLYSVYSHIDVRQPKRHVIELARGHGLDCYTTNGNDAIDVYETVQKSIGHIKDGKGPAFIEAHTYRWREHCGPNYDNHIGYRTEEEFHEWKRKDPIELLKEKLLKEHILTADKISEIEAEINKKIEDAFQYARSSPFPDRENLEKNVYAD